MEKKVGYSKVKRGGQKLRRYENGKKVGYPKVKRGGG